MQLSCAFLCISAKGKYSHSRFSNLHLLVFRVKYRAFFALRSKISLSFPSKTAPSCICRSSSYLALTTTDRTVDCSGTSCRLKDRYRSRVYALVYDETTSIGSSTSRNRLRLDFNQLGPRHTPSKLPMVINSNFNNVYFLITSCHRQAE